jgi:exosortase E/protease (VPEID-CTERM system)
LPRQPLGRLYLFAAILAIDCALLAGVPHIGTLLGPLAPSGIAAFAVFIGLGYSELKARKDDLPFSGLLFCAHLVCVTTVFLANLAGLRGLIAQPFSPATHLALSAILLIGIALLGLACIPLASWIRIIRATHSLWLLASLAGATAWLLRRPFESLWDASNFAHGRILQIATFHSVWSLLRFLLPDLIADPSTFTLGTSRFLVLITAECSGMEGLGLVLVFTLVWLWYFRKENRFPHALLLVPCALAFVWVLNIVRIAAIVLIGNAGAPTVAMVGFHSQAGWIAFTAVALIFSMATRRLSWVRRKTASPALSFDDALEPQARTIAEETGESPATAAYLVPFLAILAASFVSKAFSGYFEWLYPLRFVAAAVALWHFRREYTRLDWRFSWIAPITGAAIFLIWIAPAWTHERSASFLGSAVAALSPAARYIWITVRVAAAVITVPIAEELAFRGYLARRLVSRNFDSVLFSNLTSISVGVSSVAFGLMHGGHWIVGILAGLAYAVVLRWKGRIGDAFVAHATSNLLLAVWVLSRGDWAQW